MMAPETVVTVETNKPSPPQGAPSQQPGPLAWIKINIDYYKTVPGILKLVELFLGILCMALASPGWAAGTHWFLFVVVTSFITTLIWVFVYFLGVREALMLPINWTLTELFNTGLQTLLYFIAFVVEFAAAQHYHNYGSHIAAAVFGLFNTLAYAASTYFVFLDHKSSVTVSA